MSDQLFKDNIPIEILYSLLDYIYAFKTDNFYTINNSSFKKLHFMGLLDDFLEIIEPYYFTSKLFYIKRKITYSRFLTIIRQICNSNMVKYTSEIKYIKSKYDIHYHIYINNNNK